MSQTFFFYDLETSGLNARSDRIMQFAGQRTNMDLEPIGEPVNILVNLNDDTLPSPEAVMVTGITPQSTLADGMTEAQFAQVLVDEVFTPNTVTIGFNSIRFDDEFIRHLFWRTFRDPYEWSWKDGRSRWDMLDVVRMTRALRPEGIDWPVDSDGKPTNRLELLTKTNNIAHQNAHDALSDVRALIDISKLLRNKQPKLFEYLFSIRDKKAVQKIVNLDVKQPFVYTSGRYDNAFNKTTVAFPLTAAANGNVVVYDLRYDPSEFINLTEGELTKRLFASWEDRKAEGFVSVPVKTLQYNHCPAVAPVGVLEQSDGWGKVSLTVDQVETNKKILLARPDFAERIREVLEKRPDFPANKDVEARLYDGFVDGSDKLRIETVRNADAKALVDFHPNFIDERLSELLLHYKARSYPNCLSENETVQWESWRADRLTAQLPPFLASLQRLVKSAKDEQRFLLEELQLWAEAIMPLEGDS